MLAIWDRFTRLAGFSTPTPKTPLRTDAERIEACRRAIAWKLRCTADHAERRSLLHLDRILSGGER